MRGKTWTFECAEHREFGGLGWRMAGNRNADPLAGMAVAHDVLEHALNGDMGVEDELQALGASFRVREYSKNMHSLGANVGSDLPDVLAHVWFEDMRLGDCGRTVALSSSVECEIDDAIECLVKEAQYNDTLDRITPEVKRRIRGWMRIGYRRACERWQGVRTRDIFDEIEERADYQLKHAMEGYTRLHVTLTFERGIITDERRVHVRVWTKEQQEDY